MIDENTMALLELTPVQVQVLKDALTSYVQKCDRMVEKGKELNPDLCRIWSNNGDIGAELYVDMFPDAED